VTGRIFPDWSPLKVGIGPNLLFEAVAYVVGKKKGAVVEEINLTGDAGNAIEHLIATKEQTSFFRTELETADVYREFETIAHTEGKGSQREKVLSLRKLFGNASPLEARYLSRLVLEELRIGVGEGNVRDAIAKAFHVDSGLVEHTYQAINDLGEVAELAKEASKE
jgi:DNA ligase-1